MPLSTSDNRARLESVFQSLIGILLKVKPDHRAARMPKVSDFAFAFAISTANFRLPYLARLLRFVVWFFGVLYFVIRLISFGCLLTARRH